MRGFVAAAESDQSIGQVINLGSSFEITMRDTAELIAETMNAEVEFAQDEQRLRPEKSEVERLWADTSKAQRLMDWQPVYAGREGFKRGLRETIQWFLANDNTRQYKSHIYNI